MKRGLRVDLENLDFESIDKEVEADEVAQTVATNDKNLVKPKGEAQRPDDDITAAWPTFIFFHFLFMHYGALHVFGLLNNLKQFSSLMLKFLITFLHMFAFILLVWMFTNRL